MPTRDELYDEAIETLGRLLRQAVSDARAKHAPSKRLRVFLTLDA